MLLCAFARHVSSRCCVSHASNSRHWLYNAAILASASLEVCRPAYMFRVRQRNTLKLPRSSSTACLRLQVVHSSFTIAAMPGVRLPITLLINLHVIVAGESGASPSVACMLYVHPVSTRCTCSAYAAA